MFLDAAIKKDGQGQYGIFFGGMWEGWQLWWVSWIRHVQTLPFSLQLIFRFHAL
jgi:hypothetical protein